MRFWHLSDLHLNHLENDGLNEFVRRLSVVELTDLVLCTGDITVASSLRSHINLLASALKGRLLYVLGNHDLWGGSFATPENTLKHHSSTGGKDVFMDLVENVDEGDVTVVGDSGWYDGRLGLQGVPQFIMNDWYNVSEYRSHLDDVRSFSAKVADAKVSTLELKLNSVIRQGCKKIIVLTHVPPYQEACRYNGKPSDLEALPWFSSQILGDVVDQAAAENPDTMIEVLCGHTHDGFVYRRSRNVRVTVAPAAYGAPHAGLWSPALW